MTTQAMTAMPSGHYRLKQVVKSEFFKIVTLRSSTVMLTITVLAALLIDVLTTHHDLHRYPAYYNGFDATQESLTGLMAAVLTGGVFGALLITGEYASGTIRTTLSAAPRRGLLLAGKLLVTAVYTALFCELLSFACFFLGEAILAGGGAPSATLSSHGAFRAVFMTGLCIALMALMSFGFGLIFRSTAGAIAAFVGVMFVLELVMHGIAPGGQKFLPTTILTESVTSTVAVHGPGSTTVSPAAGLLLMVLYAGISIAVGAGLFLRRDV